MLKRWWATNSLYVIRETFGENWFIQIRSAFGHVEVLDKPINPKDIGWEQGAWGELADAKSEGKGVMASETVSFVNVIV